MRICVTGAAGFIGSQVCAGLTQSHEVIGIDDLSTGTMDNLSGLPVQMIHGSILESDLLEQATKGAEVIVHLAARPSVPRSLREPVATHEANATGTIRVLEAARRTAAHVIVASSSSVYGANPVLPKHEDLLPAPVSPYAASKLAAEQYALAWQRSFDVPVMAFRFFNVFGPHQAPGHAYAAVIPAFIHAVLEGRALQIHGDGMQSRDFTYVGTVVDVITQTIDRRVTSDGPVNLAFGTRTSLLELIDALQDVLGIAIERVHGDRRAGDVEHSQADNRRLRQLFPAVAPVDLRTGLQVTAAWMRTWMAANPDGGAHRRDSSSHIR